MDKKEFHRQKREIERNEPKHKALKLKSSLVPDGAKAYDLFTVMIQPLYEKRKDEWIYILMNDLARREEDGLISLEALSKNEEFITIVTKATLLAQQNHQEEKIEALKNLVVNSAMDLKNTSELFDWTNHFLHIVDRISPMHILLLKTFRYPKDEVDRIDISLDEGRDYSSKELFFELYQDLKDRSALIDQCWKELERDGLIISNESFGVESGKSNYPHTKEKLVPKTSDFGNKFLDMIESEE